MAACTVGCDRSNRCYKSTERATGLRECLDLCAPHGAPACISNAAEMSFLLEQIPAPYQPIPVTMTTAYRVPGHYLGLYQPTPLKQRPLTSDDYSACVSDTLPAAAYKDWAPDQPKLGRQQGLRAAERHDQR